MSDLIDLNSPDSKGTLGPKLASPLIPIPTSEGRNDTNTCGNTQRIIVQAKARESLENNPFDKVLHETTEYISKKDDPFEVVLEKALKSEDKKIASSKLCSVEPVGSCNTPRGKRVQRLKLNRTLDNFHMAANNSNEECIFNLNKTEDFSKCNSDISFCDPQPADLSILNQSAMNDTLWDVSCNNEDQQLKSLIQQRVSICIQKGTLDAEKSLRPAVTLKPLVHCQSLSQGVNMSPRKVVKDNARSHSLIDTLKLGIPSSGSTTGLSLLNDGFLGSNSSCTSVFSILSNISDIRKANSVSLGSALSLSGLSDQPINRAFLKSYDSATSDSTKSSDIFDCINKSQMQHTNSMTTQSTPNTASNISEISELLKKLKLVSSDQQCEENLEGPFINNSVNECSNVITAKKHQEKTYDKFLNTDSLTTNRNHSKEHNKSFASDWSSDSVFCEKDKTGTLILDEAKSLADIFDGLAHTTESGSSTDELLSNNTSWKSKLLPAFDDEPVVEDLILLPTSPEMSSNEARLKNTPQCTNNINGGNLPQNDSKLGQNAAKILEAELITSTAKSHKLDATVLLLDLKKIVRTENNPEADQLLENLEEVLGVKYKDNTELLVSCLQLPNNLVKSPAQSDGRIVTNKHVEEKAINKTQDNNLNVDSVETVQEGGLYDNITLNNLNIKEMVDKNEKSLMTITSDKSDNVFYGTDVSVEDYPDNVHESMENNDNYTKSGDAPCESLSNSTSCDSGEKVALDLLANLSKLLSGQCQDPTTVRLIKNLGTVLNLVSSNCDVEDYEQTDQRFVKNMESSMKNKSKSVRNERASVLSKSISELTSKIKASAKKSPIRRMSVSQLSPTKIIPGTPLTTNRNTSQLKNVKKRFSSDPGFINSVCDKKRVGETNEKQANSIGSSNDRKDKKSATIHTVKTKLKKKMESSVVNKKGPLKAVLPVGSMQRRSTYQRPAGKKTNSLEGSITPPSSKKKSPLHVFAIVTSTPDSLCSESMGQKSPKTKPVASSTPDIENSRTQRIQSQLSQSSKKPNFICDISPVTTQENNGGSNNRIKESPKRSIKLSSPKRTSHKTRQSDSGLPKYLTSPSMVKRSSIYENGHLQRRSEYGYKTTQDLQKGSPISLRRTDDKRQASPLKESNKIAPKIKACNLVSKLRRHSGGNNYIEKEHF